MRTPAPAVQPAVKKVSAAAASPVRKTPAQAVPPARKPAVPPALPPPACVVFSDGSAWKMHGRHAVAYVGDVALAALLLDTDVKNVAKQAMAVYYDRKGKAFAYQVRFSAERWDSVCARLTGAIETPAVAPIVAKIKPAQPTPVAKKTPAPPAPVAKAKPAKPAPIPKTPLTLFELPSLSPAARPGQAPSPPPASTQTTAPRRRTRAG